MKGGNVTAAYEAELKATATHCPLCGVPLIREPFQAYFAVQSAQ